MKISSLNYSKKSLAISAIFTTIALTSIVVANLFPNISSYPILLYGGISLLSLSLIVSSFLKFKSYKSNLVKATPISTPVIDPPTKIEMTKADLIRRFTFDPTQALTLYISLKPTLSPEMDKLAIEQCLTILLDDVTIPDEQIINFEKSIFNETSHFHLTALGICYIKKPDLFPNRDLRTKVNYFFRKGKEANCGFAFFAYGLLFKHGSTYFGISVNEEIALIQFQYAAQLKLPIACLLMAKYYDPNCELQHQSIKKDLDKAIEYYREITISGNEARWLEFFKNDPGKPLEIYVILKSSNTVLSDKFERFLLEELMQRTIRGSKEIDKKHLLALEGILKKETSFVHLTALGAMYLRWDLSSQYQAMHYFELGIQNNYPPSSYFACWAFSSGRLRDDLDKEKAFNYLQTSANLKYAMAQFTLAAAYDHSSGDLFGQQKNLVLAKHWYQLSADQGFADAQINLGFMIYVTHENDKAAFELFNKAASQQSALGYHAMSGCYKDGRGVAKDETQAKVLLAEAEKLGFKPS